MSYTPQQLNLFSFECVENAVTTTTHYYSIMRKILLHTTLFSLILLITNARANNGSSTNDFEAFSENQPVVLVQNNGQVKTSFNASPEDVLYYAYQGNMSIFIQANCISYQFFDGSFQTDKSATTFRTDMKLVGAQNPSKVEAFEKDEYFETHYNVLEKRVVISPSYHKVVLSEVYPNIDWVVYVSGQGIKYDFVVRPGGDASLIKLQYDHADKISINNAGGLDIETKLGKIQEAKPYSYTNNGAEIKTAFAQSGNTITFNIEAYNKTKTLTIDPDVVWTSYLGGAGYDEVRGIVADESGNIYLTGFTSATSGIATAGMQTTYGGGNYDAFVSKFSISGQRLWTTYIGGNGSDFGNAISLDVFGNIYIAGTTSSTSGLAVGEGLLVDYAGGQYDGFSAKFSSNGSLLWCTYLGGFLEDGAIAIDVSQQGNLAVLGYTHSSDTYVTDNYQNTFGGGATDMLLTVYNENGELQWNTYIGSTGDEYGNQVAYMGNDYIIVGGSTSSTSNVAVGGFQTTYGGGISDGYVGVFNADGTMFWSSYVGGPAEDEVHDISINMNNDIYLSGSTASISGVATVGASQVSYGGGEYDAFIGQFTINGEKNWVTYFGGEGLDRGNGVAVDELGNVFLGGITSSLSNIFHNGFQTEIGGGTDLMFAFFTGDGLKEWSSYYGGMDDEAMFDMNPDENSRALFAGSTQSSSIGFNGWDTSYGGNTDAFFGKVQDCNNPYVTVDVLGPTMFCQGEEVGMTVGGADDFDWSTGDSTTVISVDTTMQVYVIGTMAGTNCKAMSNVVNVLMLQVPEVFAYPGGETTWCGIGGVWLYASTEEDFEAAFYTWSTSAIGDSIFVTEAGNYSASVMVDNGCEASSLPVQIEVIEPPLVVAAINAETACISTPFVNMIALPYGGTFYGDGVEGSFFVPELAGGGVHEIYYEYIDEDGCVSQSTPMFIEVLFEETVLFVDANELCLNDDPIGMYGFPEGGYFSGPGVSEGMFYPQIAGVGSHEVFYNYLDANGCSNRGAQIITVNSCMAVGEIESEDLVLQVYPNPAQDILYFNTNSTELNSVRIFNAIGQIVFEQAINMTTKSLNVSALSSGMYTIQFNTNTSRHTFHFIKS